MNTRLNRTTLAATAMALTLFAGTALAGPEHGHHKGRKGPQGDPSTMVLRVLAHQVESLDLTDAQAAAIDTTFKNSEVDLKANKAAAHENRKALHALLTADVLDEDALASVARIEGDLVAERIVIAATATSKVKAELDADQLAALQAQAEKFRERAMARRDARNPSG